MIVICSPQAISKALQHIRSNPQWIYLGENMLQSLSTERQLNVYKRIEIGDRLQATANSLRQPYIDYIGELSVANNNLLWWISSLSEKNPWASKTFLYACYIKLCQQIIDLRQDSGDLLIVAENKALRTSIASNLSCQALNIEPLGHTISQALRNTMHTIVCKAHFFVTTIYKTLLARSYKLKQSTTDKEIIALHNWVDSRSFDTKDRYNDNYFGGLASYLRNAGKIVITMPLIRYTISYRQTLKKLKRIPGRCLIPESYLTLPDINRIFIKSLLTTANKRAYPHFENLDISRLIADDLDRDWKGNGIVSHLLLHEAIKRWEKANVCISHFIYAYENQAWEKACLLALRKFYPNTRITGYQHATVPKMILNHFFSKAELSILPFPDRVITTGRHTEKLFKESGYEPTKVICGGALRYNQGQNTLQTSTIGRQVILVTPSIDKNEVIELVWKVLQAFGQRPQYKVIFKFHPDCSYQSIANSLQHTLPAHFVVSDKPVSELLLESSVLLYTSSTTSIEALALGIPVLHIKSSLGIDRDNLSDFPDIRKSVSTTENIINTVESLLLNPKTTAQAAKDIVVEMLEPVSESILRLFF